MTSDAKIGLLVGLLVIFIIAFIINGLPRLRADRSGNDLLIQGPQVNLESPGIASRERNAQQYFMPTSNLTQVARHAVQEQSNDTEETVESSGQVRSSMPLPTSVFVTQTSLQSPEETLVLKTVDPGPIADVAREVTQDNIQPDKGLSPLIYKVQANDSLASIAKKCYGPVEGNKKLNIDRLFGANRLKIKSPDEIYIDQNIIIPPLPDQTGTERLSDVTIPVTSPVTSSGMPAGQAKEQTSAAHGGANDQHWYVVCEGDSLWKIAQARLGNGSRYMEIVRLNAKVLSDEDNLSTGMRLRLPPP